ncbi:hypothetical protein LTR53_001300 [Teratosphaeriaceae sp. CCFEE 6253]|nr:hypothetical protein LTR53_001300 [Teratosphaeriaceae sp. CCFEE 6253]
MENRRQSGLWTQADDGFYEQQPPKAGPYQYYEPPARKSGEHRRSYSDRAGNGTTTDEPVTYRPPPNGVQRSTGSQKIRDLAEGASHKLHKSPGASLTNHRAAHDSGLRIDPNAAPANVRSGPWSPDNELSSPRTNATEVLRQGSVPDRSPLQKLEREFEGKTEKRAKMEAAERRAREKSIGGGGGSASLSAEGYAAASRHGTQRSGENTNTGLGLGGVSERRRADPGPLRGEPHPRRAAPETQRAPGGGGESAGQVFQRATQALRSETSPPLAAQNQQQQQQMGSLQQTGSRHRRAIPVAQTGEGLRRSHVAEVHDASRYYAEPGPERGSAPGSGSQPRYMEDGGGAGDDADLPRRQVSNSGSTYRRRARDAGFVGAAAAMAVGAGGGADGAADRGKQAHERRKSLRMQDPSSPVSPQDGGGVGRSGSKKLRKRALEGKATRRSLDDGAGGQGESPRERHASGGDGQATKQALQHDRMGGSAGKKDVQAARAYQDPDPVPRESVALPEKEPLGYKIPPQTAAAREARELVGFHGAGGEQTRLQTHGKQHKLGGIFHRHGHEAAEGKARGESQRHREFDEPWRGAPAARVTVEDLEEDGEQLPRTAEGGKDPTWWEKNGRRTSSGGTSGRTGLAGQYDGPYEEEAKHFRPVLYLKCGPLLRFTGIRKEAGQASRGGGRSEEKEVWHGSIMIVTDDRQSDYASVPMLRLFRQPMDLHTPPPKHILESGHELPPEYEDPVAGQVKLSRTGRPLYVRHVHEIDGEVDLSREENPQGLYAATRTPMLGPQSSSGPDGRLSQHITFQDKSRVKRNVAEKAGRYREVPAHRLHAERGCTFWRFNLAIELGHTQHRIAYRINRGPAVGFWVPAYGETMNLLFHSCNGFSLAVDPHTFSGPDPLWRDVLNRHQARPFHAMLGGGDQIYNDAAMRDTTLFADWLHTKNLETKHRAEFTAEMREELEEFYLNRYAMWFSQGLFAMAGSQIPMVNLWDDHDIIDGFGSYPHHFMSTRVFTGVGAVAFKYYMLFQHQSVVGETEREEPSWLLGASPGPYIAERSRSVFLHLGRRLAFLGLDCRTERMRDEVLSQETYDLVFDRCRAELVRGETKHLIVLLGVPIAYPRLNFLENMLTSKLMDPIKALGRTGVLGGFVNKFDGGVEVLDDLDDHWTPKGHKAERNWFIQELQALAAEKSVRITILGGDVHLGAVGQFYTPKKFGVGKDRDHRYMPNIVSSAIVNTPPPNMLADTLNKRNKVHHLDAETDEDLIPMFDTDVDGSKRNNKCLLPRRNYCTIREYVPGSTPPSSPRLDGAEGRGMLSPDERGERRYPPGSMKRTMSLTRGPGNLIRRLSGSGRNKGAVADEQDTGDMQRTNSLGGSARGSYFAPQVDGNGAPPQRPTNQFHRRPTSLSVKEARKAASKGGPALDGAEEREPGHIDLQCGLDISLNMEIDQKDPGGSTVGYRLLVPALWYEGGGDPNTLHMKGHHGGLMGRLRGHEKQRVADEQGNESSGSRSPSPPPERGQQRMAGSGAAMAGAGMVGGDAGYQGNNAQYADRPPTGDSRGPGQEAFKTRRPSLMDRLRGRSKRDVGDDDLSSRSGSPSPPPTREGGLFKMRGASATAPGPYGVDGARDDQRAVPGEQGQGTAGFKQRRPSFIQRLTGRGKRDEEDAYSSRSGSPSPPPSRGQQHMGGAMAGPAAAGVAAGAYGHNGVHESPRMGTGNEQRPETFKTRRPSFMDRIRGRGKQDRDDDSFSSHSGSPSPPPGRGQPGHMRDTEPPAAAGAQREPYGTNGGYADNDPTTEQPQFKSRRPSFMDRLRGRGRREVGDDGYSRSPTPSPPPSSRGQQMPQHGNTAMAAGGQYRAPQTQAGRRIASDTQHAAPAHAAAHNKGYNLGSPPIGSAPQPTRSGGGGGPGLSNNPYPQSGTRHVSAPLPPAGRQQPLAHEPWRREDNQHYSSGSFTGSDEYLDDEKVDRARRKGGGGGGGGAPPARRASKAERFFGIGDDTGPWGGNGGPRRPSGPEGQGVPLRDDDGAEKRKPGRKVWT